jgi:thiamine-monophosphate kinase
MSYPQYVPRKRVLPQLAGAGGELALLRQLRSRAAMGPRNRLRLGIGDDCALLRTRRGEELAITTDLSIEGRHFRLDWTPPESVGHRTLARGLSDLAAMGARPLAAFLSLGLARELTLPAKPAPANRAPTSWMSRFLDGLLGLAQERHTVLAGGDLAESPLAVADIVLVGAVPAGRALLRSGARPGDLLYVTGSLGGAAAGLEAPKGVSPRKGTRASRPSDRPETESALARHLYPSPRVDQGLWLLRHEMASSAIDLSDGLSTDLSHLCEESAVAAVAAEVDAGALPVHPAATLEQALHGGEDYELLFTSPPTARVPRSIAGVPVTCIGRMVKASRGRPVITLLTALGAQPLERRGWEHFS